MHAYPGKTILSRLMPAAFLFLTTLCFAQADVDIGGSGEEDGAWDPSYAGDEHYDDRYGSGDAYGREGSYGGGPESGMPIVYAGDGMRVSIEQVDDSGTYARGTLTIDNQPPMAFELQMQLGQYGELSEGRVTTPSGPKPIRARDEAEEVTVAEFEGRRYRLAYQQPGGNSGYPRNDGYNNRQQPIENRPPVGYENGPPRGYENGPPGGYGNDSGNARRNSNAGRQQPPPAPRPVTNPAMPKTVELVKKNVGSTHTLLVPKGWTVEGGAWSPPPQATAWMPSQLITVTGPDGSKVIFRPNISAIDQRIAATPRAQPGSLNATGLINLPVPGNNNEWAQFIQNDAIRAVYKDASDIRVTNVSVVPELTAKLRKLYEPQARMMASFNASDSSIRSDQLSMSVESAYSAGGSRWQQIDAFNHLVSVGQVVSAFGGYDYHTGWDIRDAVSIRAPEGSLDAQMPVLLAIVNSLRQTPEYTQQIARLQMQSSQSSHDITMQTINTYMSISQSTYNANNAVNDSMMQSFNERNASQDRGQRDFVNYIHDQQDYADPSVSGNVTLPASYDRVFSNGRGEYVLTNDVSFEPGADWNPINRARN